MSKSKNKQKKDIEAKIFMFLFNLKEEKNKKYLAYEGKKNTVYLFENHKEFKNYFELNGFVDISGDLLEMCRIKTTQKGTIIALKGLCDYTIRKHNSMNSYTMESSNKEMQNDNFEEGVYENKCLDDSKAKKLRLTRENAKNNNKQV